MAAATTLKRNRDEDGPASRTVAKQVTFSASSVMYVYDPAGADAPNKRHLSYTGSERRSSMQDALAEALRLKRALGPASQRRAEAALPEPLAAERLCERGIPYEEVVGLEHLVLGHPHRTLERREAHMRVILAEQEVQKRNGAKDEGALARLSILLARRPASQARSRAAMAARGRSVVL